VILKYDLVRHRKKNITGFYLYVGFFKSQVYKDREESSRKQSQGELRGVSKKVK
jgi:hypothetical protein